MFKTHCTVYICEGISTEINDITKIWTTLTTLFFKTLAETGSTAYTANLFNWLGYLPPQHTACKAG